MAQEVALGLASDAGKQAEVTTSVWCHVAWCRVAESEKGEGCGMHQLSKPSKCLAIRTGSQMSGGLPCGPWPVWPCLWLSSCWTICVSSPRSSHTEVRARPGSEWVHLWVSLLSHTHGCYQGAAWEWLPSSGQPKSCSCLSPARSPPCHQRAQECLSSALTLSFQLST